MKVLILSFFSMIFANQGFAQNSAHVVTYLDSLDGYRYEVHADMWVTSDLKKMFLENPEMKRVGIENEELLPLLDTDLVFHKTTMDFFYGICRAFPGWEGEKVGSNGGSLGLAESQDQKGYTLENYLDKKIFARKWSVADLNNWVQYLTTPKSRRVRIVKSIHCQR